MKEVTFNYYIWQKLCSTVKCGHWFTVVDGTNVRLRRSSRHKLGYSLGDWWWFRIQNRNKVATFYSGVLLWWGKLAKRDHPNTIHRGTQRYWIGDIQTETGHQFSVPSYNLQVCKWFFHILKSFYAIAIITSFKIAPHTSYSLLITIQHYFWLFEVSSSIFIKDNKT